MTVPALLHLVAMQVNGHNYRTIWIDSAQPQHVCVIDQRLLPHRFEIVTVQSCSQMIAAIKDMTVRGAPLIGVAAAYGMYLAARDAAGSPNFVSDLELAAQALRASRPTAVNLAWAVDEQWKIIAHGGTTEQVTESLKANAGAIAEADIEASLAIGNNGLELLRGIAATKPGKRLNILTHCNAGWLCAVEWGTATAPIYRAFDEGIDIHVYVDETRPRNQGASLTAWELEQHGVPYTLIVDNTGGHLMQNGMVDAVIVGTDRVARNGDVANKIGTYLKALAARDNDVPFYVAAPASSIDWSLGSGRDVPIEQRDADEVKYMTGWHGGELTKVLIAPENAAAANYGFDVTPARLVSALITERGVAQCSEAGLRALFPDKMAVALS